MLVVKNLAYKRYEQSLFKNVGFTLFPGNALQIMGQNGIGKTTLLRVIAGLNKPSSGAIISSSDSTLPPCFIGHQHNLHPSLTVLQNLRFLQGIINYPIADAYTNLHAALDYFNLKHKVNTKCSELSAGQQQRVSLARLYNCNAKLWLLDEPLANLDNNAAQLLQLLCIKHLNNGGCIIAATHKQLDFTPFLATTLHLEHYV